MSRLHEALETRRFAEGTVKLPQSSFQDPHIQNIINIIVKDGKFKLPELVASRRDKLVKYLAQKTVSTGGKITHQLIFDWIGKQETRMNKVAAKAPILYHTMKNNVVAGELFHIFQMTELPPQGAKFSTVMFYELVRAVQADQESFFPMENFLDRRRLRQVNFVFMGVGKKTRYDSVPTACATPGGDFAFNVPFCQKLMDWAYLVGEKPKGLKYVSNGGDIPDEYAPIEFLIMHEFMHYVNGDFYYDKIIRGSNGQKADQMTINWVGDFRSNYLLCKSGYQPLPIGLYNDMINYDRQTRYKEMYDLIEQQMKLAKGAAKSGGKGGKKPKPPPYVPKVGDVVENNETWEVGEIVAINADGTVEVKPVDPATLSNSPSPAQPAPPMVNNPAVNGPGRVKP